MNYSSTIQINDYQISTSSDNLYEYISQINWSYLMTDNSGNTESEIVVSTFNEITGYVYDSGTTISNQTLIDFLNQNDITIPIQNKLTIKLNKITNPIIYRWYIYEMQVIPDLNGLLNFVTKIIWRYNAIAENGITANIEGITIYNEVTQEQYIDYYSLTESEINLWLDSQENILDLRDKLDNIINEIMNPVIISLPIPW